MVTVYLDHHAAAPLCPAAERAMTEAAPQVWANPASIHGPGRAAKRWLERAREQVAAAIGGAPSEVVLTGGGTEACNLGIAGLARQAPRGDGRARGVRLLTTAIEHPAVSMTVRAVGGPVALTPLAVPDGEPPSAAALEERILSDSVTAFACQWVNHETGTVLPVAEYAQVCRQHGVWCFIDGTQAAGKVPLQVGALEADALALASHKLGGPAGAGALWIRRGIDIEPVLGGGGQERGRRPGTPDVLSQVGFGAACEALAERLGEQPRVAALRDRLEACLVGLGAAVNGAAGPRVASVVNGSFQDLRGDQLVAALDIEGLACASGAACSSGLAEPSAVIAAMYPASPWRALGALRLSLGPTTHDGDIERAVSVLERVVPRVRRAGPASA